MWYLSSAKNVDIYIYVYYFSQFTPTQVGG